MLAVLNGMFGVKLSLKPLLWKAEWNSILTPSTFFEIRAGGYNGSTYTLTYDPAADVLKGVYFQAVAQQKFDVYFTRAK